VAFLRQLPQIDEAEYRELVFGKQGVATAEVPHAVIDICARCHGIDGEGRETSAFPRLDGLHADYFLAAMQAYSTGKRRSGIMEPIAGRLNDDEVDEVAAYYSRRRDVAAKTEEGGEPVREIDEDARVAIEKGELIAQNGLPEQGVGACIACHRADVEEHNPNYAVLNGQFADYLVLQLTLFKQRQRGGSDYAKLMHSVADGLKLDQMRDVAAYYALLPEDTKLPDSVTSEPAKGN
jgi:cytochrome c553